MSVGVALIGPLYSALNTLSTFSARSIRHTRIRHVLLGQHISRIREFTANLPSRACGDIDQAQHGPTLLLAIIRVKRHNRRVFDEFHVNLRGLGTGHRIFRRVASQGSVALQPSAHRSESVEVAFDLQGFQRLPECQGLIPRKEIAARIRRGVQVQRFGAMHRFQPRRGVESAGFAHQIGEMILQTGGPHAVGTCRQSVTHRTANRTYRRLTVETAEDIAGTESDEQTIDLRQHIRGEERDGNGIAVFQIMTHRRRQIGTHLLKRVPVAGLEP